MAPRGAPRRKEEEQQVLAAIDDNIKTAYSKVRPPHARKHRQPVAGGLTVAATATYAFAF